MPAIPPLLAIAIGDVTGIGPEVTLKAIAADLAVSDTRYLLIGDEGYLARTNTSLGLNLTWEAISELPRIEPRNPVRQRMVSPSPPLEERAGERRPVGARLQEVHGEGKGEGVVREVRSGKIPGEDARISLLSPMTVPQGLPCGAAQAANAALAYLQAGAELCLRGGTQALVTAPVSKEAIIRAGHSFVGQTEFLSELAGAKRTAMMLLGTDHQQRWIRVVLATTHIPVREIANVLTTDKVKLAIDLAVEACQRLGLPQARIAVCGLNPHAGEGGNMGTEEINIIQPAIDAALGPHRVITGPLAADTVFYRVLKGEFDAVVAMYHDQGLAPLKMAAFDTGVNWTLGLPFIRTSPDHGTAYDIAGKGLANPSSMLSAIRLARQLCGR